MATIRPFRAVMPAHTPGQDVSPRVAPPYDVISPEQRERLVQRDPHNIVELELPEGPSDPSVPGNRYQTGAATWKEWLEEGALVIDERPAVYVVEQRFGLGERQIRRQSLVAAVGLEPFDAGVILPHERTLPKALDDRMHLLRATRANLSQVFGLFSDPEHLVRQEVTAAIKDREPEMTAVDDDGVESLVWAIHDPDAIERIAAILEPRQLFIADGHHRYTTALAYRDERWAQEPSASHRPWDSVMMALTNMDDPNLVVLATHRVADAPGDFVPHEFREALEEFFEVAPFDGEPEEFLADAETCAFVMKTPADAELFSVTLRADVDPVEVIPGDHCDAWKRLDVAILQELVLSPLLDIHPDRPETLARLSFVKDGGRALIVDDHDLVVLLRPTGMDELREVALAGERMPQKSTYFYPKLLSGLIMRSLDVE